MWAGPRLFFLRKGWEPKPESQEASHETGAGMIEGELTFADLSRLIRVANRHGQATLATVAPPKPVIRTADCAK
jgi:hypothetical protein